MSDVMKDVIDQPGPSSRGFGLRDHVLTVLISVVCTVPMTLAVLAAAGMLAPRLAPGGARVLEQTGRAQIKAGQEGEVHFPIPYESPPNVELENLSDFSNTQIAKTEPHGFRWKNSGPNNAFNNTTAGWRAKGVVANRARN
jgi:hypothetical protein